MATPLTSSDTCPLLKKIQTIVGSEKQKHHQDEECVWYCGSCCGLKKIIL